MREGSARDGNVRCDGVMPNGAEGSPDSSDDGGLWSVYLFPRTTEIWSCKVQSLVIRRNASCKISVHPVVSNQVAGKTRLKLFWSALGGLQPLQDL